MIIFSYKIQVWLLLDFGHWHVTFKKEKKTEMSTLKEKKRLMNLI